MRSRADLSHIDWFKWSSFSRKKHEADWFCCFLVRMNELWGKNIVNKPKGTFTHLDGGHVHNTKIQILTGEHNRPGHHHVFMSSTYLRSEEGQLNCLGHPLRGTINDWKYMTLTPLMCPERCLVSVNVMKLLLVLLKTIKPAVSHTNFYAIV